MDLLRRGVSLVYCMLRAFKETGDASAYQLYYGTIDINNATDQSQLATVSSELNR